MQQWLQIHGLPGRMLVLGALCLPVIVVLLTHPRKR